MSMILQHDEIETLKDLKQFFSELEIPQKIVCVTGHSGEGKSSISFKAGNKLPAYIENLDRHTFDFHKDHSDRISEIANVPLTPDVANNPKKLLEFHLTNVCKDKKTFLKVLEEVGPYAEKKLCQNIIKARKNVIQGNNTNWKNAGFHTPDISTTLLDGFALYSSIGKQADKIFKIAASRPDLSNLITAKRQGVSVPKELEQFLYTGASFDDAKKQGFNIPYELEYFLHASEMANAAASEIREKTLSTLNFTQLINKTILNEAGEKTDKEMKTEVNAELERVANNVVEFSRL